MSKQFKLFKEKMGKTALTLALVGATTIGASAATNEATTTANLNMREQGTTNSKIVMTIPKGQKVNVIEEGKSWDKVEYKGKQGYSYKRYLKQVSTQATNVELKVTTSKGSNLNVRTGPSTNYKVIGKLKSGSVVKASAKSGSFYKINHNGQVGYISADYVKVVSNNGGNNNGGTETVKPMQAKGRVTTGSSNLNIRKTASTSASVVGKAKSGSVLEIIGQASNGWYQVKFDGNKTGFVSNQYITLVNNGGGTESGTVKPMTGKVKVTTNGSNLNIRSSASTAGRVVGSAKSGSILEITGQHSNGWYEVKMADGTKGYVSNQYVTVVNEETKPEVKDEAPVITVKNEVAYVEQTTEFARGGYIGAGITHWGATATDKEDGDLTDKITVLGNDDLGVIGERNVTLSVKDSAGNTTTKVVKLVVTEKEDVKPEENQAPVITSVDNLTLEVGQAFDNSMLKASATDKEDGKLEVKVEGNVDTGKVGIYTLTLTAKDSKGLEARKTVTVTVKEKEVTPAPPTVEDGTGNDNMGVTPNENKAPVINSVDKLTLEFGQAFDNSMLKLDGVDEEDGKVDVSVEGTVDTNKAGDYTLVLTASDNAGLKTTKTVIVTVKEKVVVPEENTAPVMTVGNPVVTITEGDAFDVNAFNAVAEDKEDGRLQVTLVGNYDANKPGEYSLQLVAKDSKGLEVKHDVKLIVKEKEVVNNAPTVTAKNVEINQGDNFSYDMLDAKATDVDGDKVTVTYEGTVDTTKPGKYAIKVIATDDKGLSSSINVTVTVKEVVSENTNPNDAAFKNAVASQMLSLVNNFRAENGVHALRVDSNLVGSSNAWSKLMADKGVFDHVIEGKDANAWFPQYGNMVGLENIAMSQFRPTGDKAQDAVNLANTLFNMWKGSAGHANSMKDEWSNLFGFGFHAVELQPGVYTIYATQHFSTDWDTLPMSAKEEAPVVEEDVKEDVQVDAPVVEEEKKEEVVVPEEQPQVEEEKEEVVVPEVEEKEEEVVVPEEQPQVEIEDTVTEPTVEME